ncbi:MAG: HTH domain-containing protein [Pseudomonadota bacterium]
MRASRLLQILLLLQNRGRMTAPTLADELEVAPRTILRDVDAMTEAGLPIIVFQGRGGGIELGFNYRTRLTGLATDEAEALGVLLQSAGPAAGALGLGPAAARAIAKLIESLPDRTRALVAESRARFRIAPEPGPAPDPRVNALAKAIRAGTIVRLRARSPEPIEIYPAALNLRQDWWLEDVRATTPDIPIAEWGDINISARKIPQSAVDASTARDHTQAHG